MNPTENIKEKAMLFACFAHQGQFRKSEKEKPMIVHPIEAGRILEKYGFDDNVVAAGYLHDVIEDTKYTAEDIMRLFGEDITSLVVAASESDKSMSWEDRKLETIRKVRGFDERKKAVVCADKISNLTCLKNLFDRKGKKDFSAFKRGEELQSWYYSVLHRSFIYGIEDTKNEMYDEMKELVDDIFYSKVSEEELQANLYVADKSRLQRLKKINASVSELSQLKSLKITENKPVIIEFLGTMRAGKTSAINALEELLKKEKFKVKVVREYTTSEDYKQNVRPNFKENILGLHNQIFEKVEENIEDAKKNENLDFILIDRGLNDRLIWLFRLYSSQNLISKSEYEEMLDKWKEKANRSADIIVSFKIQAETSMKREYASSISLAKKHFMNVKNVNEYNIAMTLATFELFNPSLKIIPISTENDDIMDANINSAAEILNVLRDKEIKEIKRSVREMARLYMLKYEEK